MPTSPELLLTLSPEALRDLVATFGPLPSLRSGAASPFAIARTLSGAVDVPLSPAPRAPRAGGAAPARVPAKLATLVASTVARFCTHGARLALVEAARALGDARADAWLDVPAADVAAGLAVERATASPRARRLANRLFALAHQRIDRDLPERPTYELVAESPVAGDAAQLVARLRSQLGDRLLNAWAAPEADGALGLSLFLRQPAEMRLVVDRSAPGGIAQRCDVPVAVDSVRVFAGGARVAVTAASPELLPAYAAALGLGLRPSLTLRPLMGLTLARLAALSVPRVTRVDIVGARLRQPGGLRAELRGADVLDPSLHSTRTGYFDRATVRVTVDGAHKVDAFLHLPHRLDISDRTLDAPVRAALAALGFFAPGALLDDAWSLAPYEHGEWRWRAILGDAIFERMVAHGRFARVASAHVASEEHRMHGAAYTVREVAGEPAMHYALAEDRSLGARLVSPRDRVAWRLDLDALRATLVGDLGSTPVDAPLAIAGLLDLGTVTLADGKLRFVYAVSAPAHGWVEAVRRACGLGVTPVVLVPRGQSGCVTGMLALELDVPEQLGARRAGRVLGRAAEALGVAHQVAPWRLCEEEVVVKPSAQALWVCGVRMVLSEHPFGLVARLAALRGGVIATKELGAQLSTAGAPDVTARKAKAEAERQIRAALDDAGVDSSIVDGLIVAEGKKGYRLGVAARVIED